MVEKVKRQAKTKNYSRVSGQVSAGAKEYLRELSKQYKTSMSRVLDAILRRKPDPDDFYLR